MHARPGVEQDPVVEQDAAGIGGREAGDAFEGEGFPGAAWSVKHGHARVCFDFHIEREGSRFDACGELFRDAAAQSAGLLPG